MNTITTTITTLSTIATNLRADIDKAQQVDGKLLDLFTVAREHVKDAINCLRDAAAEIEDAKRRAARLAAFDEGDILEVTAYVYVFNTVDYFRGNKYQGQYDRKRGANIGITYEEEEMLVRFVCCEVERWGKEDYSWQDHNLPKNLRTALGIDEENEPINAPGFMPVRLARQIAAAGEVVLTPVRAGGKVKIRLVPCPDQADFAQALKDINL